MEERKSGEENHGFDGRLVGLKMPLPIIFEKSGIGLVFQINLHIMI